MSDVTGRHGDGGAGRARAAFGFAVVLSVLGVVPLVAGRAWLGTRTFWGLGLVGVSLVALAWWPRGRAGALWAAALLAAAGLVVSTDLCRDPEPTSTGLEFTRDLPPLSVHGAALGLGVSVVVCGVVAAKRASAGVTGPRHPVATIAGAALVAAVPVGGGIWSLFTCQRMEESDHLGATTDVEADEGVAPEAAVHVHASGGRVSVPAGDARAAAREETR